MSISKNYLIFYSKISLRELDKIKPSENKTIEFDTARLLVLCFFSLEKREKKKKKENLADIQEHVTNITRGIINKVRK